MVNHDKIIGQLNFKALLAEIEPLKIEDPIYLEADFQLMTKILGKVEKELLYGKENLSSLKVLTLNSTIATKLLVVSLLSTSKEL